MFYYLKTPKKAQVLAFLALGWSYRGIEAETGVRRETVSGYDAARQATPASRGGQKLLEGPRGIWKPHELLSLPCGRPGRRGPPARSPGVGTIEAVRIDRSRPARAD
jgi:hypothetical protein